MARITRNSQVLEEFVAYCKAHPEQRFWQALRNWAGFNFILAWNGLGEETADTFDWEGRRK